MGHVDKAGPDGPLGRCWTWQAGCNRYGYAVFWVSTADQQARAGRWIYEATVGPIPEGLTIDHVCHSRDRLCPGGNICLHRRCVNPAHLEPVTHMEQTRRKLARV